jgi:dynein heavy chain
VWPDEGKRKGHAELWLAEVEGAMRAALHEQFESAVEEYLACGDDDDDENADETTRGRLLRTRRSVEARTEWVLAWPAQVSLNGVQIFWTAMVETALLDAPLAQSLHDVCTTLNEQLTGLVLRVRETLPTLARRTIGAILTIDVRTPRSSLPLALPPSPHQRLSPHHLLPLLTTWQVHQRDVVKQMANAEVREVTDFAWLAQLRYYWEAPGPLPTLRKVPMGQRNPNMAGAPRPGDEERRPCVLARMMAATMPSDLEYLGATTRLVITPLTDRCYRTLINAVHMFLGGAAEGPAGTGKTETIKDLAKALAKQCVVFNCSEGLDYLAMAKLFKGLASTGAWSCFDEFNRIEVEVLSVVAQQVATIQRAVALPYPTFNFEGSEVPLHHGCATFITMNPTYTARSTLPDNLKALFRPCAMTAPSHDTIAEISLYSYGFHHPRLCTSTAHTAPSPPLHTRYPVPTDRVAPCALQVRVQAGALPRARCGAALDAGPLRLLHAHCQGVDRLRGRAQAFQPRRARGGLDLPRHRRV